MLELNVTNLILTLFCMIFMHIIADYIVQTDLLAKLKVNRNWDQIRKDNPQFKWKYDYVMVLFLHSFSWTFMIMIPVLLIDLDLRFILGNIVLHTILHMEIDDMKANQHSITFLEDQLLHFVQILVILLFEGYRLMI